MTISEQIQVISDKVDLIHQNYQYSINLTVTLLALSITIAGVALYNLAKLWVNKSVNKELEIIKSNFNKELETIKANYDKDFKSTISNLEIELKDYVKQHQQLKWATGISPVHYNSIQIHGLKISKTSYEKLPYKLELYAVNNPKKKINYEHKITNGVLYIDFLNHDSVDGSISWSITWVNDEIYKVEVK